MSACLIICKLPIVIYVVTHCTRTKLVKYATTIAAIYKLEHYSVMDCKAYRLDSCCDCRFWGIIADWKMCSGFQSNFWVAFIQNLTQRGISAAFCLKSVHVLTESSACFQTGQRWRHAVPSPTRRRTQAGQSAAVVWSARPSLSVTATAASGQRTSLGWGQPCLSALFLNTFCINRGRN